MVPPRMPHRAPNSDPNKTGIKRGTYKDNNGATSPECQENKGLFSVGEKKWEEAYEDKLAEGEGFEPSIRNIRMPPFQGGTFNHSAILPR